MRQFSGFYFFCSWKKNQNQISGHITDLVFIPTNGAVIHPIKYASKFRFIEVRLSSTFSSEEFLSPYAVYTF